MGLLCFLAGLTVGIVITLALGLLLLQVARDWEGKPTEWEGY